METSQTFRHPDLSLWQSAISKVGKHPRFFDSVGRRMNQFSSIANITMNNGFLSPGQLGGIADECVKLVGELVLAELEGNTMRIQELYNELKMSTCDPGWVEVIKVYLAFKRQKSKIPYIRYRRMSDFIIPIPNVLRIGFIGDWGTGSEDAEWLLKEMMRYKPNLIIHLGDIYYAGTTDEVRNNFFSICKRVVGKTPVLTLSGNHDMYSGGKGYYWLIRQLNQPASYFCLRNDHWQFLAMDTGLHDSDPFSRLSNLTYLDQKEVEWHLDKFKTAGKRKSILLSHHQLFSALGIGADQNNQLLAYNPNLHDAFHSILDNVSLWLWGHEHNLIVFEPYLNLRKGRCLGAGAIPMMVEEKPYIPIANLNLQGQEQPPIMDLKKAMLSVNDDGFYFHSFAIMSLHHETAGIDYYEVDSLQNGKSKLVYSESIE